MTEYKIHGITDCAVRTNNPNVAQEFSDRGFRITAEISND